MQEPDQLNRTRSPVLQVHTHQQSRVCSQTKRTHRFFIEIKWCRCVSPKGKQITDSFKVTAGKAMVRLAPCLQAITDGPQGALGGPVGSAWCLGDGDYTAHP